MTRELELCPFCKGEALLKNDADLGDIFYKEWVQCNDCGASAPIEAWNTRAVTEKQALLNKIAEAAVNGGWQPIETAPRDGSKYWIKNISGNSFKVKHSPETEEENEWWEKINDITVFYSPTHWKPLNGELAKLVAEYKERFGDDTITRNPKESHKIP